MDEGCEDDNENNNFYHPLALFSPSNNPAFFQCVCNAMQFLTSVAEKENYARIYGTDGTLQALCERVIVPNMQVGKKSRTTGRTRTVEIENRGKRAPLKRAKESPTEASPPTRCGPVIRRFLRWTLTSTFAATWRAPVI